MRLWQLASTSISHCNRASTFVVPQSFLMSQRVFSDTATAASSISVDPSATATGGSGVKPKLIFKKKTSCCD